MLSIGQRTETFAYRTCQLIDISLRNVKSYSTGLYLLNIKQMIYQRMQRLTIFIYHLD